MKFVSKLFSIIGNILFYIFILCFVAYIVLMAFGIRPFITMSGSMEPNIHTGSLCFVNTRAEYEDIEERDVIAFRITTGGLVTHRVIAITEDGFETKGDANNVSDGISTTTENFYGETLFSIPYLGYAMSWLNETQNKVIVIIIALTILVLGHIDGNAAEDEEIPEENVQQVVVQDNTEKDPVAEENTQEAVVQQNVGGGKSDA